MWISLDNSLQFLSKSTTHNFIFPNRYTCLFIYLCILWRVEPLLCNHCEMGGYTRAVSGQWLSKNVPAATDTNVTIEELCFLCGPCRDVISKGQGESLVSSVLVSVKRGPERGKLKISNVRDRFQGTAGEDTVYKMSYNNLTILHFPCST
jgi:hypothetical protein